MPSKKSYLTVTDQFCGAGGSSLGAAEAGAEIHLALNHWDLAIETHNTNFPDTRHDCTDISATDPRRYPSTDILISSPECFPAGTLILAKRGLVLIEDIRVGDLVFTHRGRWRPVTRVQSQTGNTVVIKGQGHSAGLEVTPNHRFYAREQTRKWNQAKRDYDRCIMGDPEWVPAGKLLDKKYRWASPCSSRTAAAEKPILPPAALGADEATAWWLVGRWLADGWCSKKDGQVVISCGRQKVKTLLPFFEKSGSDWRRHEKRTAVNFSLYDRPLRDWLTSVLGRGAARKNVPGWFLDLPTHCRKAILDGYISGDGYSDKRRTRGDSVSKALALGIRLLAESLGFRAGFYRYEQHANVIEGRKVNVQPFMWVTAWERNKSSREAFEEDNLSWGLVKEILPGRRAVEVFNLEVGEDHSYVADGIVVKNCTNHSLAKGRKRKYQEQMRLFGKVTVDPSDERSRATMWDIPRFCEFHDYNIVIVENVVDVRKWRPFDAWLQAMHLLGYEHKVVYFNSMFAHPTPQSRDRIYVVFWKKGNPAPDLDFRPPARCAACQKNVGAIQSWKNPNKQWGRWGRYKAQYVYRCPECAGEVTPYYYAAFNAIDWSIKAPRIGDRKRPLAEKTMARIRYGLERYGRQPLIITGRYTSGINSRVKVAGADPLPTQPGDASHALLAPPFVIETLYSHGNERRSKGVNGPLPTQTGQQGMGLVAPPMLVSTNYYDDRAIDATDKPAGTQTTQTKWALVVPALLSKQYGGKHNPISLDGPLATVTTADHHAFVGAPFIAELYGTSKAKGIDDPLGCVTAGGINHALISHQSMTAFLSYYYGQMNASGMAEPLQTVTTVDRAGLVQAIANARVEDCTFRMLKPHEIGAAMAFPGDYIVLGNQRQKVKQYGNAVTPPIMRMLMEACVRTLM